jgi:OHCU decarboxylase
MTHHARTVAEPAGIDDADRNAFVARFGGVFEHSPWVAAAAYDAGPFGSAGELHAAMVRAVDEAPRAARLELIRAHPELAGRAAIAGELSAASGREQNGAGLDRLTPDEHARLIAATTAYRRRFGFPFVICVREHTTASIIESAERRAAAPDAEDEERAALAEIAKIAALRLADLVGEAG